MPRVEPEHLLKKGKFDKWENVFRAYFGGECCACDRKWKGEVLDIWHIRA